MRNLGSDQTKKKMKFLDQVGRVVESLIPVAESWTDRGTLNRLWNPWTGFGISGPSWTYSCRRTRGFLIRGDWSTTVSRISNDKNFRWAVLWSPINLKNLSKKISATNKNDLRTCGAVYFVVSHLPICTYMITVLSQGSREGIYWITWSFISPLIDANVKSPNTSCHS